MEHIKKNILYNLSYEIFTIIIGLTITPYISRILGVENVGIYSYTNSIVFYFILFATLGLRSYGNRVIAKVRDNKEELSKQFMSLYLMQIITTLVAIVLYVLYLLLFEHNFSQMFLIQSIFIVATGVDITWLFMGLEKFKIIVDRIIIIKIISLILIFIFVRTKENLMVYTIIMVLTELITQLALWYFAKKEIKFVKVQLKSIKVHVKPNIMLFFPILSLYIYKIINNTMLGTMTNMTNVGLYANAQKIISIPVRYYL